MRLTLLFALAVLGTGCSALPEAATDYRDVDQGKMAAVEENAARNGVRVYWINPPRKPAP